MSSVIIIAIVLFVSWMITINERDRKYEAERRRKAEEQHAKRQQSVWTRDFPWWKS